MGSRNATELVRLTAGGSAAALRGPLQPLVRRAHFLTPNEKPEKPSVPHHGLSLQLEILRKSRTFSDSPVFYRRWLYRLHLFPLYLIPLPNLMGSLTSYSIAGRCKSRAQGVLNGPILFSTLCRPTKRKGVRLPDQNASGSSGKWGGSGSQWTFDGCDADGTNAINPRGVWGPGSPAGVWGLVPKNKLVVANSSGTSLSHDNATTPLVGLRQRLAGHGRGRTAVRPYKVDIKHLEEE